MNTPIRIAQAENRVQIKKFERSRWSRLSVSGIRRWFIFHPLAVALALANGVAGLVLAASQTREEYTCSKRRRKAHRCVLRIQQI